MVSAFCRGLDSAGASPRRRRAGPGWRQVIPGEARLGRHVAGDSVDAVNQESPRLTCPVHVTVQGPWQAQGGDDGGGHAQPGWAAAVAASLSTYYLRFMRDAARSAQ